MKNAITKKFSANDLSYKNEYPTGSVRLAILAAILANRIDDTDRSTKTLFRTVERLRH